MNKNIQTTFSGRTMGRFTTLFVALCAASAIASAQHAVVNSLTLTQGQYRLTLTAPTLTSDVSAFVLSEASGWKLGGNAATGSLNQIGTTDAVNLEIVAGSASTPRLILESGAPSAVRLPNQTALHFAEATAGGTEFVGLVAPAAITTSYTVTLPAAAPTAAGQVMRVASSPAPTATEVTLEWAAQSGGGGGGGQVLYNITTGNLTAGDATFQNGPSVTVQPNKTYLVEARGTFSTSDPAGDPSFRFDGPVGATYTGGYSVAAAETGATSAGAVATIAAPTIVDITALADRPTFVITGTLVTSATGGAFRIQFNRNAGAGTVTLIAGASLKVTDVTP